jgi:hypothetical protein
MSPYIHPYAVYVSSSNNNKHNKQYHNNIKPKNNYTPHHPLSLHNSTPPSQCDKHNLCHLSANQHSSPWHTTDMCPLKDPTFILNKIIRERVMHNNLYGKINKNYNKNMDIPSNNQPPPAPKNTLIIFFDPLLTRHLPTIILLLIHPHHFLLWMTPHHHTHLTKSCVLL